MKNSCGEITEVELGGQNITDGGEATHLLNLAKELKLNIIQRATNINQLVCLESKQAYYSHLLAHHHKKPDHIYKLAEIAESIGHLIELFCEDNALLKQALFSRMMAYEGLNPYQQSIYHNIETLKYTLSGGVAQAHEFYEHQNNQIVTSFIEGGNAKITLGIAENLEGKIHYNKALKKLQINSSSAILTFKDKSTYTYDYVVLAIPASTFKNIDLSNSRIDNERLQKINMISYGANYKIALPIRIPEKNNANSIVKNNMLSFYNHDKSIQLLYVNDTINNLEDFIDTLSNVYDTPIPSYSTSITPAADENYKLYNENVCHHWKQDPYAQGSYTGYSTQIAEELDLKTVCLGTTYKALFAPIENILFFAGEHTTLLDCIGTMEAAVESGERIAKAVKHTLTRVSAVN